METIKIFPYNEEYEVLYKKYEALLKSLTGVIAVEFIGSASAKLAGKREIDILITTKNIVECMDHCTTLGFRKGPIESNEGYLRLYDNGIIVELHVVLVFSKKIEKYLKIVQLLHQDEIGKRYEALKWELNGKPVATYKLAKSQFIASLIPPPSKKRRRRGGSGGRKRTFTRDTRQTLI